MFNILVTGGCGFIGSNFIRLLSISYPQCNIINLDKLTYAANLGNLDSIKKDKYTFVKGNIRDSYLVQKVIKEYQIDTIVHFAAESHVDRSIAGPRDFIDTNIYGTFNLLEIIRKNQEILPKNFIFIHVSTDEVYGTLGETGLFTENTPYSPRSPYSASKAASDHLVNSYFHTYNTPVRITNCSNNYGPCQFHEKLVPLTIKNCVEGIPIPIYGDGLNIRDWLYVQDHCEAILKVLENGVNGESYNIGGNNEQRNIDIVTLICDIIDIKIKQLPNKKPRRSLITYVDDRLGHDKRYAIDATKIKNELGWQPRFTFKEGLELTIDYYLK